MKVTQKNNNEGLKKAYFPPVVEKVSIDIEISLVMMSPPGDPSPMAPLFNPLS